MNTDLLRKLVMSIVGPEGHTQINDIFSQAKLDPDMGAVMALQAMVDVPELCKKLGRPAPVQGDMILGVLFGITMSSGSNGPIFTQLVNSYLEHVSKSKGENVFDFSAHRFNLKKADV